MSDSGQTRFAMRRMRRVRSHACYLAIAGAGGGVAASDASDGGDVAMASDGRWANIGCRLSTVDCRRC